MFCSSCGNQMPENARFCHYCAHPVAGGSGPTIIINQPKEKTVSASGIIEAFFAVILIAAVLIGGMIYYRKYQRENQPLFQLKTPPHK